MEKTTPKKTTPKKTAAKKTTAKKTISRARKTLPPVIEDTSTAISIEAPEIGKPLYRSTKKGFPWTYVGLAVLIAVVGLLALNRNVLLAAIVNGQPIFRWELNNVLTSRYGQQTLEGMVTEKLVLAEAQKENIAISKEDIDKRVQEILQSFGSTLSVDEFLKMQGLSRAEFENQLRLQMIVQQILSKDLTITDQDIANFIASNSGSFVATEPAKLREEARNAIVDEHVGKKFQEWLAGLREKSTVQTY